MRSIVGIPTLEVIGAAAVANNGPPFTAQIDPATGDTAGGEEITLLGSNYQLGVFEQTIAEVAFADMSNGSPLGAGQPFVQEAMQFLGDGRMITGVTFMMWKIGSPTGMISCHIGSNVGGAYGDLASTLSAPTIATATSVDISTLSTSPSQVTFVFPQPVRCEAGVPYWVDIGYFGGDGSNYLGVGNDNETHRVVSQYALSNADSIEAIGAGVIPQREAQSFVGDGSRLQSIRVWLQKVGSPTGNLVMKLYSSAGAVPNAVLDVSDSVVDVATLTGSPVEHTFIWSNQPTLTNGVTYWLSLEYGGGDGSNYVGAATKLAGTDPGGNAYYNDGAASWFANTRDLIYAVDRDPYAGRHRIVDNPPTAWFPVLNNMVFKLVGRDGPVVEFDSIPATRVQFVSGTELRAYSPAHAAGAINVRVTNPDGLSYLSGGFEYVSAAGPPVVTSVRDTYVDPLGGGRQQRIYGTDFVSGATITVDGVPATGVTFISATELRCTMPAGTAGPADVVVTNPDTQNSGASGNGLITYWEPSASTVTGLELYLDSRKSATLSGAELTDLIDQVSGSRTYSKLPGGTGPEYRATEFGGVTPSFRTSEPAQIVGNEATVLARAGSRTLPQNGRGMVWGFVGKTTSADAGTDWYAGNCPNTVIGDYTGSIVNSFGMQAGSIKLMLYNTGWFGQQWEGFGAAALNDGVARLLLVEQDWQLGRVRGLCGPLAIPRVGKAAGESDDGTLAQGSVANYTCIAGGYVDGNPGHAGDAFKGDLGAIFVLDLAAHVDMAQIEILDKWARQSFDTADLPTINFTHFGASQVHTPANAYNAGAGTWAPVVGDTLTKVNTPGPSSNGSGSPRFAIATDYPIKGTSASSAWMPSACEHYFAAKVYANGATSWGTSNASVYTNPKIVGDTAQFTGLHMYKDGVGGFFIDFYDWPTNQKTARVDVSALAPGGTGTFVVEGKKVWNTSTSSYDLYVRATAIGGNPGAWTAGDTNVAATGALTTYEIGPINGDVIAAIAIPRAPSNWEADKINTLLQAQ